jgi:hypothetical protein
MGVPLEVIHDPFRKRTVLSVSQLVFRFVFATQEPSSFQNAWNIILVAN